MRISLLTALSCLLAIPIFGASQNAPARIAYNITLIEPANTNPAFVDTLFSTLSSQLSAYDIPAEFTPTTPETPLPEDIAGLIDIRLFTTGSEIEYIPIRSPLADISPYLLEANGITLFPSTTGYTDILTAYILYSLNHCELAIPLITPYQTQLPTLAPFFNQLIGNCHLIQSDFSAAALTLTPLAELTFTNEALAGFGARAAVNLAWVHLQNDDPTAAFDLMNRLIVHYRSHTSPLLVAQILAKRAELHALAFQFDNAINDITEAIMLDPQNATYYKQRGDHIFLIYEWDRVLTNYNRAIELAPDYADAYYARGVLFYTQGPRSAALEDFQQFMILAPHDPRISQAQAYIQSIETELDALEGDDTGAFGPSD